MEKGLLLKGVGSFYEVLAESGDTVTCKARGLFRKKGLVPTVGDHVLLERQSQGYALLTEILPRKNILIRPPVANIDQIFLVVAAIPEPDWLLLDKLLIQATRLGIDPVPVYNKSDLSDASALHQFHADYAHFFTLTVSAKSGDGIDALRARLSGRISCFAGQSAVGKSSLLNALFPEWNLPVGEVSPRTDRGRHTTRHAQLWPYNGGAVLDTPGFSFYDSEPLTQIALNKAYPEFSDAPFPCRYPDCMHDSEPDCGIKKLVSDGILSRTRYDRYLLIAQDFQTRRKHRYD